MSHIRLIYNPMAGRLRRRPELVEQARQWLAPLGEVSPTPTTGPATAGPIAAEAAAAGVSLVVAFGGDGTVNEVANGLIGSSTTLAVLPGGTANVLCIETGLGSNPEKAARKLVSAAEPVRIAVGRMVPPAGAPRHFLVMAGVGLDAIVVEEVSPAVKKRLGKVAYWVAGLAMFGRRLPQFRSRFDGHTGTKSFLLASRVRNYGGDLEIARRVSLLDPCFETVAFEGANSLRYLPYFAGVLVGQVGRLAGVTVAPATELHCEPENGHRIPIQLDGELAGHLPASFHIVPEALTLLLPKAYVDRARQRPWITSPTH